MRFRTSLDKVLIIFYHTDMKCDICPRLCNVDRSKVRGFCQEKDVVRISKVMIHKYEEPIISGTIEGRGSGAIFSLVVI